MRAAFPSAAGRRLDGLSLYVCTEGAREYWLARTGMGPDNAGQAASRLLRQQAFSLALSTGFACALVPAEIGALLIGRDVVAAGTQRAELSSAIEVPGVERDEVLTVAGTLTPPNLFGRFASTERVIGSAAEKQLIARATGAIGLDMESAALAVEASRAQVPFAIVRAVSDLLEEDLPLDFNLFLRPTGWLKGVATVLGAPSSLLGLKRLRRQSRAAADNLTVFFRRYAAGASLDAGMSVSAIRR